MVARKGPIGQIGYGSISREGVGMWVVGLPAFDAFGAGGRPAMPMAHNLLHDLHAVVNDPRLQVSFAGLDGWGSIMLVRPLVRAIALACLLLACRVTVLPSPFRSMTGQREHLPRCGSASRRPATAAAFHAVCGARDASSLERMTANAPRLRDGFGRTPPEARSHVPPEIASHPDPIAIRALRAADCRTLRHSLS